MSCKLVEGYHCFWGTHLHNSEEHSLNNLKWRMVPQLAHTVYRHINFIKIFLHKPSDYYNNKHVNWINKQKYLFPFCCCIKANLFELPTASICFKWRPLFRWSVWLMHHSTRGQPWPDHMLLMWNTHLHARRKSQWYLRWSGTLVQKARANWMAVWDWVWMTKLHWPRATSWCWQSIYSLNKTLAMTMLLVSSRAQLSIVRTVLKSWIG